MAEKLEIYKCKACGNIVEVLHGGAGALVCCGEDMKLFKENTEDAAQEKHVPVIEKTANGYKVTVYEATDKEVVIGRDARVDQEIGDQDDRALFAGGARGD